MIVSPHWRRRFSISSISGSDAPSTQILFWLMISSVWSVREPIPASGLGVRHNPAGPAGLFSDALQGLPEGTCKGVSREDAERRMVRPKEHFDGVDLPLGLRDADGSDGVGQLAHDDLLHRLLVGVYEGACWKDAERRMIRPEQGLDCVDRPRGLRDADGSDSILELNGNSVEQEEVRILRGKRQLIPSTRRGIHLRWSAAAAAQ